MPIFEGEGRVKRFGGVAQPAARERGDG